MQKTTQSIFNKISLGFIFVLSLMFVAITGVTNAENPRVFNPSITQQPSTTATQDGVTFAVQKVLLPDVLASDTTYDPKALNQHLADSVTDVNNNDFVYLNTSPQAHTTPQGSVYVREAMYIYFGEVGYLNIDVQLNGKSLAINDKVEVDSSESNPTGYIYFNQYLHGLTPTQVQENPNGTLHSSFNTSYKNAPAPILSPEGKYDIIIHYRTVTGGVSEDKEITFTFYLITQDTYNAIYQAPTFNNTEKYKYDNAEYSTKHFFHFNNYYTTSVNEFGEFVRTNVANQDRLYYPTLTFNPEKYLINYVRTLYNYRETVNMDFTAGMENGKEVGVLTLTATYNNGTNPTTSVRKIQPNADGTYTVSLRFDRVGEYTYSKTCRLRTGMQNNTATYVQAGVVQITDANLLKPEVLVINGYQATYAQGGRGTAPLFDETYHLTSGQSGDYSVNGETQANLIYASDFTFMNTDILSRSLTSEAYQNDPNLKFDTASNTVLTASTNQPPVMFEYYGAIDVSSSWYEYTDLQGNISYHDYTRGMQFTRAGKYIVYIAFSNLAYIDNSPLGGTNSSNIPTLHQVFAFSVNNSPIDVSMYSSNTTDSLGLNVMDPNSKALNIDDFTNKNVYFEWKQPGPFDSLARAVYSLDKNFDGQNETTEQELTALNYKIDKDADGRTVYTITNNIASIFTETGYYTVKVYHNRNSSAYVVYTFTIDKESISGIQALEVNNSLKKLQTSVLGDLIVPNQISTLTNFNLVTNQSFAWTWDSKRSGAQITAKYTYAPLSAMSAFDIGSAMAQDNGQVWVAANGSFGGFLPIASYTKVDASDLDAKLLTSQIINSPQFAVLLLSDSAGNTAMFITVFDNVAPEIIQEPPQTTYVNVITQDTKFTWGTHKALNVADSGNPTAKIDDVKELLASSVTIGSTVYNYAWTEGETSYIPNDKIQGALNNYFKDYGGTTYFTSPISEVSFPGEYTPPDPTVDLKFTPRVVENLPLDHFVTIKVFIPTDKEQNPETYILDSQGNTVTEKHYLNNGDAVWQYTLIVNDEIYNPKRLVAEVNLDQSRGTMYSYYGSCEPDGLEPNVNRQVVSQGYSTNRKFVTFSWTEPVNYFHIQSIVLNFYPLVYNEDAANYPYSDTALPITIYQNGEANTANEITAADGRVYYQTNALQQVTMVPQFSGPASQAGKYVITRIYSDEFDTAGSEDINGDIKERNYIYYVDRDSIISTENDSGTDIKLQLGYDKGADAYKGYPEYGGATFNEFARVNLTDTFESSFITDETDAGNNKNFKAPTRSLMVTNVLPVSLYTPTFISENNLLALKYYKDKWTKSTDAQATQILQRLTANYKKNASLQILVQYFIDGGLKSQTLYSGSVRTSTEKSKPLAELNYAFKNIGKYRIIMFDLSNYSGTPSGNLKADFSDYVKPTDDALDKHLTPNYSIINFDITGIAPKAGYQDKVGNSEFIGIDIGVTKSDNLRVTFSDPSDVFTAQIAYKDITITRNLFKYGNPVGSQEINVSDLVNFNDPTLLTDNQEEYDRLIAEGKNAIFTLDFHEINRSPSDTALTAIEYYKVAIAGSNPVRYNYYLLLPPTPFEQNSTTKQYDCTYQATLHYIGDSEDYRIAGSENAYTYYSATHTVYVDHTAPYENLKSLIQNDTYIKSLGTNFQNLVLNNIENEEFTFLQTYAFSVPSNFRLKYYNDNDTYGTGGTSFYYKKYDSYTGAVNAQTVVPGTAAYDDPANVSRRFSIADPAFRQGQYKRDNSQGSFPGETGYYDIVEQDLAGNYRVYTVFVNATDMQVNAHTSDKDKYAISTTNEGITMYHNTDLVFENTMDEVSISSSTLSLDSIDTQDTWFTVRYRDLMHENTYHTVYLTPNYILKDLLKNSSIVIYESKESLLDALNGIITQITNTYLGTTGSKIEIEVLNRSRNVNMKFFVKTPGRPLVTNIQPLIKTLANSTFQITLPQHTLSTQIVNFEVYMGDAKQATDYNWTQLPTATNPPTGTGTQSFVFSHANNTVYRFYFYDNFGNMSVFSYPVDESIKKELNFAGGTLLRQVNGTTYTYTSNATQFIYQSNALSINLKISNMDTGEVLVNCEGSLTANPDYYTSSVDSLTGTITTINFKPLPNVHYLYDIQVGNYADTTDRFAFVMYTYFPTVNLTDTQGSILWTDSSNMITSKDVVITWESMPNALFNPRITLISGTSSTAITSPHIVSGEGEYTIQLVNDMGVYTAGTIRFSIRSYIVSVYGVFLNSGGESVQLEGRPNSYLYVNRDTGEEMNITQYFFLGANESNWNDVEIIRNEDKQLFVEQIDAYGNTRIYHLYGRTTHYMDVYFAITRIPRTTTNNLVPFSVNGTVQRESYILLTPVVDQEGNSTQADAVVEWNSSYTDTSDLAHTYTYSNFYVLELWFNNVFVGNFTTGNLHLTESGVYTIYLHDLVGQTHKFGASYSYYTLTLLNDVIFTVNGVSPIQNSTFNTQVDLAINNISQYKSGTLNVSILKNKAPYTLAATNGHYIFTEPGVYEVSMSGNLAGTGTNTLPLTNKYYFTILSATEARSCYEFSPMTGYEIINITKSGVDITSEVKGEANKLYSFFTSPATYGVGRYSITVRATGQGFLPVQEYTFEFWINDEIPNINTSRDWGSSSTADFTLTINPATIYERIGSSRLVVNGETVVDINAENAANEPSEFTFSEPDTYIIQLYTESGNLISSQRITINVPLNTASIILIVVACLVVVGLTVTFILMRTRMKVR